MDIKTKITSLQAEIEKLTALENSISGDLHSWCVNFGMTKDTDGDYSKESKDGNWIFQVLLPSAVAPYSVFGVLLTHTQVEVDVIDEAFYTAQETLYYLQQMPPLVARKASVTLELEAVSCDDDWAYEDLTDHLKDALDEATITCTDVPIEWKLPNKSQ